MKIRICVPISLVSQLQEFFDSEEIGIEIVTDGQCDVKVIQCDKRKNSNLKTIYSGGWVTCEMARGLAKKIKISLRQIGKMLDHLDVKIRRCSLGCFK